MFQVGPFLFDPVTGTLGAGDTQKQLEPLVSSLLLLFCQHPGQLLPREKLLSELWSDRIVSDDALRVAIRKLRDVLGDDARHPRYIKTQPMQGYTLIAETSPLSPKQTTLAQRKKLLPGTILFAVAILCAGLWQYLQSTTQPVLFSLQHLTQMNGSEVNPDYDPIHHRLVFAHRANQDDFLQLYSKHLSSGRLKRLTWDEANYVQARWSADGARLLFTRTTPSSSAHYVAEYDDEKGIVNSVELRDAQLDGKYLLDGSADNQHIYLVDPPMVGKPRGIWRYHIASQQLSTITTPQHGHGDYFATESDNGDKLAILRSIEDNKRELLILHQPTGSLLHTRILPENMDRLVWSPDQSRLTLSNFRGDMRTFDLKDGRFAALEVNPTDQAYLNHLFHQCGESCYYLRAHNGNFLELAEQPNPFIPSSFQAMDYFESPGAEDWPLYGDVSGAIYFVHTERARSHLARIHPEQGKQQLFTLPPNGRVSSLSINPQETHLIGLLSGRVFSYRLEDGLMRYASAELDTVYPPVWDNSGQAFLFGKLGRDGPHVVRVELDQQGHWQVADGFVMLRPLDDQRTLRVDKELGLWLYDADGASTKLGYLPVITPNRWSVHNNWLYVTFHQENQAFMRRIHLLDGRSEEVLLARNRFRLNFDIGADGKRFLVVRSKLADSDLVQVNAP